MKYLYYPGCSLKGTAREYEESLMTVAPSLGMELEEIQGWRCCGASAAREKDPQWARSLPLATLQKIQAQGMDILMPCSSCYSNHLRVLKEMQGQNSLEGLHDGSGSPRVKHLLEVLAMDLVQEAIRERLVRPLDGLRVLPYYGCLVARPFPMAGKESMENPLALERIITASGACNVAFPARLDCCGGPLLFTQERVALKLAAGILEEAARLRPDCIVVVCPLCHLMLDAKQKAAKKESRAHFRIPVLYVTQLVGLALGLSPKRLGLHRLITPPDLLLAKLSAARS